MLTKVVTTAAVGGNIKEPHTKSSKTPHLVFMLKNTAKNVPVLRIMVLLQQCDSSQLHPMGNWLSQWKIYLCSEILIAFFCVKSHLLNNTYFGRSAGYNVRLESHCALRLWYVDLVVSIEVAVDVCSCCVTLHCIQLLNSG
jgi:hypothetical protein